MSIHERALLLAARAPRRFARTAGFVRVLTAGRKLGPGRTASFLRLTGHFAEAERVLGNRTGDAEAALERARIARDRGDVDAALTHYVDAASLAPREAMRELIELALGQDRLAEVVEPLGRACLRAKRKWAPRDVAMLMGAARVTELGEDELTEVYAADPPEVRVFALLAAASMRAALVEPVSGARVEVAPWLEEADGLRRTDAATVRARAAVSRELLDDDDAATRLVELARAGAEDDRLRYADVLLALRRLPEALQTLEGVHAPRALRMRGAAYLDAGRFDDAARAFAGAASAGFDARRSALDALLARMRAGADVGAELEAYVAAESWTVADTSLRARAAEALGRPDEAAELLRKACDRFPADPALIHQRAALLNRRGEPSRALELARAGRRLAPRHRGLRELVEWCEGEQAVSRGDFRLTLSARARPLEDRGEHPVVLHLLETSAPHQRTGYAVRSHHLLTGLRRAGLDPVAVTRPGFPADYSKRDHLSFVTPEEINGVLYHRLAVAGHPRYTRHRLDEYLATYARGALAVAATHDPVCVHAASNFKNGLAGRAVARALGVPFVYELRGLWEDTQVALGVLTEDGERYELMHRLENEVMRSADAIVTLSEVLAEDLVERGISRDRIVVAPNGVDADAFAHDDAPASLREQLGLGDGPVLGYVSTLHGYEGVDVLLRGFQRLRRERPDVQLLIVGDGPERGRLQHLARTLELDPERIFTGRIPHEQVPAYYRLIDVFVVPRIDARVTRLVLPIKPAEALAAGCALVVSDLPALREAITAGEELLGRTFTPGDAADLARTCAALLNEPAGLQALRERGRAHARTRTWDAAVSEIVNAYRAVGVPVPGS